MESYARAKRWKSTWDVGELKKHKTQIDKYERPSKCETNAKDVKITHTHI